MSLKEFRELLDSGRRLKIKFGADVTAGFLHLGHAVNLWMMREMQERGHQVQFLIGDFTTRIGDPTGRGGARIPPSREAVERDAAAFIAQVGRVLITDDPERFEVRRNSEWWEGRSLSDFLASAGSLTSRRLLARDMFRAREEAGGEIRLDEMIYPLLQGWDSVELGSDLTIVGSDQLYNESMGRLFQERRGMRPQIIITTRITAGLDGRAKQSKSLGNYIAISDSPRDMFGKAMSLADGLVRSWLEVYTLLPLPEIAALCDPESGLGMREAKRRLAEAIVERWWGADLARAEAAWFEGAFGRGEFPPDAPLREIGPGPMRLLDLLSLLRPAESRSALRRLALQGACRVDERVVADPLEELRLEAGREHRLRLGRRLFVRLRVT